MQAVSVLGYNTAQIRLAHAGEFSWVMFSSTKLMHYQHMK